MRPSEEGRSASRSAAPVGERSISVTQLDRQGVKPLRPNRFPDCNGLKLPILV